MNEQLTCRPSAPFPLPLTLPPRGGGQCFSWSPLQLRTSSLWIRLLQNAHRTHAICQENGPTEFSSHIISQSRCKNLVYQLRNTSVCMRIGVVVSNPNGGKDFNSILLHSFSLFFFFFLSSYDENHHCFVGVAWSNFCALCVCTVHSNVDIAYYRALRTEGHPFCVSQPRHLPGSSRETSFYLGFLGLLGFIGWWNLWPS